MSFTIRLMESSDWDAVAGIYQAGMDTNLATFQTECPPYEDCNPVLWQTTPPAFGFTKNVVIVW